MEEIRILLIEDDEEDYLITKKVISEIKNQKYTVVGISTYEKTLNETQKDIYDIFFVDYKLGAKIGLDLIDEGVETITQFKFLKQNNCDLFSRLPLESSFTGRKNPGYIKKMQSEMV